MAKIVIVGDLFPVKANMNLFTNGRTDILFGEKILNLFSQADLKICNLEGALTDGSDRCEKTGPHFYAPKTCVRAYKDLGIDCCMLANNHITDAGHEGILDTMQILSDSGISYIGAGSDKNHICRSLVYCIDNLKIGLYNVCETMYNKPTVEKGGAWLYDEYLICRELSELKRKCDYLIVIYHGGIEKFRYPSPEIRKRFHRMADNGADMVLSQHTHCIGCEEWYNDSYLLYGQGNFLLNNVRPGQTDEGLLIEVCIEKGEVSVKKHLIKWFDEGYVRYNDNQDFTEFDYRSSKVKDEEYVSQQFQTFCQEELPVYLNAFKSPAKSIRIIRKFFPNYYKRWLLYSWSRRNLLFTLHTLRSEQNRETAIAGIEKLLNQS